MPRVRVAAAQLNLVVGDLEGNASRILDAYDRAEAAGCDLVAFPELAITGYPPEDLLLRPAFVAQAVETLDKIAARTGRGRGDRRVPRARPRPLQLGRGVRPGPVLGIVPQAPACPTTPCSTKSGTSSRGRTTARCSSIGGVRVAITVCEDAWSPSGPILTQAAGGAELVVNINASPYYAGRLRERETMLATRAADASVPIALREPRRRAGRARLRRRVDAVRRRWASRRARPSSSPRTSSSSMSTCGPRSGAARSIHAVAVRAAPLPEVLVTDVQLGGPRASRAIEPLLDPVHEVYEALVLGTRDYVHEERLLRRA